MQIRTPLGAGITVALLAAMPAVAMAQDEAASREPAYFTAAMGMAEGFPEPLEVDVPESLSPGGGHDAVDAVFTGITLESTDPRMTGVLDMAISSAHRNLGDTGLVQADHYLYRVTNDDGSWSGPGTGFIAIADDAPLGEQVGSLAGEGAYEGLNVVFTIDYTETGEVMEGIIYAGEVPPLSDFDGSPDARAALE